MQAHRQVGGQRGPDRDGLPAGVLRRALDGDELRLRYLPVLELSSGRVVAAEALVRWAHPGGDLLPPAAFLPDFEAAGLMPELGAWVLREAITQVTRWADDPAVPRDLVLGVNLSASQLRDPSLGPMALALLRGADLPATRLHVDVPDTALAEGDPAVETGILTLDDLGVSVAVDGFGGGATSVAMLQRLPVSLLKVDDDLIGGLGRTTSDLAIVETVQQLADALGLPTIAEGVERSEQVRVLRSVGCGLAQGRRFGPPLTAPELATMARAGAAPISV